MKDKAFTLIELSVVIAVIGLLASIIIVNLTGARTKANIARGLQFGQSVHNALGAYAVGVWNFDEGSGTTANDSSGYGNNGSISGASYTTDTPSGEGYALSFNGVDNEIQIADKPEFNGSGEFSVSVWIKSSDPGAGFLMWHNGYYDIQTGWSIYCQGSTDDKCNFVMANGSSRNHPSGGIVSIDGVWHHLVFAKNSTFLRQYVDGVLSYNGILPFDDIDSIGNLRVAGWPRSSTYWFNGLIDDVRIYEKALETAQVEALYYAGLDNLLAKGLIDEQEYQERLALKH
jgi:prepilin-type N-terminal cleavage/methylation domain-containing protein